MKRLLVDWWFLVLLVLIVAALTVLYIFYPRPEDILNVIGAAGGSRPVPVGIDGSMPDGLGKAGVVLGAAVLTVTMFGLWLRRRQSRMHT